MWTNKCFPYSTLNISLVSLKCSTFSIFLVYVNLLLSTKGFLAFLEYPKCLYRPHGLGHANMTNIQNINTNKLAYLRVY